MTLPALSLTAALLMLTAGGATAGAQGTDGPRGAATPVSTPAPSRPMGLTVELRAGPTVPVGDYQQTLTLGMDAAILAELRPWRSPVRLRGEVAGARFSRQTDGFAELSGHLAYLSGVASVVRPFSRARGPVPYLLGGVGGYYLRSQETVDLGAQGRVTSRPDPVLRPGLSAGAGVQLAAGRVSATLEARVQHVLATGADLTVVPITLGLKF